MSDTTGGEDVLAPVIPLFGGGTAGAGAAPRGPRSPATPEAGVPAPTGAAGWNNTWGDSADPRRAQAEPRSEFAAEEDAEDAAELAAAAEAALLRKLRTRSLSLREARAVLIDRGVSDDAADRIVEAFVGHGYLDDVRLADQLIHSAVERKGQGRRAIAQTLAARGIPRETVDAVLSELPDDEFERALEFARTKARSMVGLDRDAALRRLSGQLARRGYGGLSLAAARQALDEASRPPSRGVRFES